MTRLYLYTIMLNLFVSLSVYAQTWNTVGAGFGQDTSNAMDVMVHNNELYVVESTYKWTAPQSSKITLKKWNGLNWVAYPEYIRFGGYLSVTEMVVYQGDIYLGLIPYSGHGSLIKFDGSSWSEVPFSTGSSVYSVRALEVHNGELYIGGRFNVTINSVTHQDVMKYDGSTYTSLGGLSGGNWVKDLHIHNGTLYCSYGQFSTAMILNWDGSTWDTTANYTNSSTGNAWIHELQSYNGDLFGTGFQGDFFKLANDTAFFVTNVNFKATDMDVYNNELYIVGDSLWSSGASSGGMLKYDGTNFTNVIAPPSLREGAVYQGELVYFSPLTVEYNGVTHNKAFRTNANFSLLSGTIYVDQNQDCIRNQSELPVANAFFGIGGTTVSTDSNGFYSVAIPAGTYSIDTSYIPLAVGKNFKIMCSAPTQVSISSSQNVVQDIPLINDVPVDAQVFITGNTGWRARHGFTENYQLDFNNAGNQTLASGTAVLELPPGLNVVNSNPAPSSVNANVLSYDFLNVQPGATKKVNLQLKVDVTQNAVGDTLKFRTHITGVNADADLSDNADTLVQIVTAAVDPNDKQASATRVLPGTERVDYHIRFHNIGNDTAYKVTVVDTLDMTLPITQILINSASHPYSLSVKNNILIWEFDNIMLPDSGTDLLASQGYVRFSAGINPSLGVGDTIDNDAEIYFDYQSPVHTNHAKTAIVNWISNPEVPYAKSLLEIYPNPAVNYIHINNKGNREMKVSVIDQIGKQIEEITVAAESEISYNIQKLSVGIYFLKSENQVFKLIVK